MTYLALSFHLLAIMLQLLALSFTLRALPSALHSTLFMFSIPQSAIYIPQLKWPTFLGMTPVNSVDLTPKLTGLLIFILI
jgi:hypothetical protein